MRLKQFALPAFTATLTLAIAVACSETPTGPAPGEEIVGGTVFQAMYIADNAGLKLVGTATSPATIGPAVRSPEQISASLTLGQDSARAAVLSRRFSESSRNAAMLSLDGKARQRIKARNLTQVIDGKRVDLIVMIDPDRAAKRPARGFVTRVEGKVVSIVEWQYAKAASGKWRRTSTRMTMIDSAGRRAGVVEADQSGAVYASATLRGPGQVLGAVARLFAPDALQAADFTEFEASYAGCNAQYWSLAAHSFAAAGALLLYNAARQSTYAAIIASIAATTAAVENPLLIPAAEAAYALMVARELAERAAFLAWATATAGAMSAGRDLGDCMTRKGGGSGGSGGEGGCASGEEPICDWSLYWDGTGSIHFEESNCACEGIWAT